jgi:hypothetical protein
LLPVWCPFVLKANIFNYRASFQEWLIVSSINLSNEATIGLSDIRLRPNTFGYQTQKSYQLPSPGKTPNIKFGSISGSSLLILYDEICFREKQILTVFDLDYGLPR